MFLVPVYATSYRKQGISEQAEKLKFTLSSIMSSHLWQSKFTISANINFFNKKWIVTLHRGMPSKFDMVVLGL